MVPLDQALPALVIALPVAGSCLLLALGRVLPRLLIDVIGTGTALAGTILAGLLLYETGTGTVSSWSGGWKPRPGLTVGIVLVADRLGAAMALLIALLTTTALLFGWRYFDNLHAHYPALVLLFATGMTGFALTGDLFDMFVFFELMGVAAYALTGLKIEEPESVQAGLNFGVVNSLGAYLCLFGIGLLYARTGQLGLAQLGIAVEARAGDALVLAAFVLIATGWLVKAAAVPFHFWLADAHAVAPSPVCVLFSGVMAPLGVYGLARVYWTVFDTVLPAPGVRRMLLVLGISTAVLGAVMCVLQRHIKRLLAYSTIAHIGLFILGLAALSPLGVAASALYLGGHAAVKGSLFLLTGVLLSRYRSVDEFSLHGRARGQRTIGVLFVLSALVLAGLPPFGAGLGKALLEESDGSNFLVGLVIVVSAITGGAALRAGLRVCFGVGEVPEHKLDPEETTGEHEVPDVAAPRNRTPITMLGAVLVLLLVALILGLPTGFTTAIGPAAATFVDPEAYRAAALLGNTTAHPGGVPQIEWSGAGLALGLLSTVLAVLIALVALHFGTLRARGKPPIRPVTVAATALHRLHSGHVGDYAAWLVFGAAVVAGLVATGWL
ncbi:MULTISPECIES: complex I subunit 5 family protein [unclassified Nocardia]|uniref:complex I subunit 5 family protein n=1 Tax=unclassified Nocardia TaxID=2637762 RepID=UPI00341BA62E